MRGELMGFPATGREASWDESHIGRFEGGRLKEHWGVVDNFTLFQQLGRPSGRPFFRPESRVAYRPVTESLVVMPDPAVSSARAVNRSSRRSMLPPRFRTQHEGAIPAPSAIPPAATTGTGATARTTIGTSAIVPIRPTCRPPSVPWATSTSADPHAAEQPRVRDPEQSTDPCGQQLSPPCPAPPSRGCSGLRRMGAPNTSPRLALVSAFGPVERECLSCLGAVLVSTPTWRRRR